MNTWDLSETYALVRDRFGADQEKQTRDSTRSINDREGFAAYHFREVVRLTREFERRHLSGNQPLLALHTKSGEKRRRAFDAYMVKAGAHAIAAIQSIHAIPDILAHSVYFATGQNLRPDALAERDVHLKSVMDALKRDESFCALCAPLSQIKVGTGWIHLDAVSNHSKHRSVIRSVLNEKWTGKQKGAREIYVCSFEREGKLFLRKPFMDLLEPEYDRLSAAIVQIGNQLNTLLRTAAG